MRQKQASAGVISQTLKAILGIRDLVFSGDVLPGNRLSEIAISKRLGISRTPVRAAMSRLEQEGILENIPSGGYAVRAFSKADVIDAIELRGVLEGMAARLAAERGISSDQGRQLEVILSDLDAIVAAPATTMDFHAYVARNAEFHEHLKSLSGSDILRREIDRVMQLPFAGPSAFLNAQTDIPEFRASLTIGQAQHRAIADAIDNREGARAEALAREHARLARQNLDFVMNNVNLRTCIPGLVLVSNQTEL